MRFRSHRSMADSTGAVAAATDGAAAEKLQSESTSSAAHPEEHDQWNPLETTRHKSRSNEYETEDSVTNIDSAFDAVEQWTQEELNGISIESGSSESSDTEQTSLDQYRNGKSGLELGSGMNTASNALSSLAQPALTAIGSNSAVIAPQSVAAVVTPLNDPAAIHQAPLVPSPTPVVDGVPLDEYEHTRNELLQAHKEIEALETSTNLYRMQLKQAKELQRVRSLEIDSERTTNESQLKAANVKIQELESMNKDSRAIQENYIAVVAEKENELKVLKLENHEYPSRILKLQAELEAEKAKFKSLADRFNSVKDMELHRQKQKFMQVSTQQKEVFDRLKLKLSETIQQLQQQAAYSERLAALLSSKETELNSMKVALQSTTAELANEKRTTASLNSEIERFKAHLSAEIGSKQNELTDVAQQLKTADEVLRAIAEREKELHRMKIYFDCVHDSKPEINDGIRVRTHQCGDVITYEWQRSNGATFVLIEGAITESYNISADDLGCTIRATVVNSIGLSASADIGPIVLPDKLCSAIHDHFMSKKDIEFIVDSAGAPVASKGRILVLNKSKIKIREGKRTNMKEDYSDKLIISLDSQDERKFGLMLSASSPVLNLIASSSSHRNEIVFAIRGLVHLMVAKQTYKETSPNFLFIQFLLTSANVTRPGRIEKAPPARSQSISLHHNKSASRALPSSFQENELDTLEPTIDFSQQSQLSVSHATPEVEEIQYDADGYIIRPEQAEPINPDETPKSRIVIKPREQAVEATAEELSRATIGFNKPPPSSSSKPKADTVKAKKKKGDKLAKRASLLSSDAAVESRSASPTHPKSQIADSVVSPSPSPVRPQALPLVSGHITETVSCSMQRGVVTDASIVGMVTLVVDPPPNQELAVGIRLNQTDDIGEVMANGKAVEEINEFVYEARVAPGAPSLPVLRYSLDLDPARIPIQVISKTIINSRDIDLMIDVNGGGVDSISLLVSFLPLTRGITLISAVPNTCLFDQEQQKLCWKGVPIQSRFSARLAISDQSSEPVQASPVLVQFVSSRGPLSDVIVQIDQSIKNSYQVAPNNEVLVTAKPFQALGESN